MVKYGKQYREYQIQEWAQHYIDYKLLKQKIKYLRTKLPNNDASNTFIDISNLISMPLEPDNNNINSDQYLTPLFNLKNGNYLKEFIDLLNEQFHKFYIFFSNTEKQLYKKINMHLYSRDNYNNLSKKKIKSELNSLGICIYLAKCLNNFVNDNLTALKKILKKFDKNFKNYFGLITPKYILSQISSSLNDLDYIIQFKIIDEASCICEENAKILKKLYDQLGDVDNLIIEEDNKKKEKNEEIEEEEEEIEADFMQLYNDLMLCVKEMDEVIDFKTQYKEWISFVKKGNKLVKNNPSLLENDIFNPLLSSTNYKDSLIEKFLSTKEAFSQIEQAQTQITISNKNKINMNLILVHRMFNNSLVTCALPNIFFFVKSTDISFVQAIIILFISIISTFSSYGFLHIPNTKYVLLISYSIFFCGNIFHILCCDSFFDDNYNFYRFIILIVSRIFIGVGNMDSVERSYIVLHSPKFYLIKISKIYSYINFIGYALGSLIIYLLLLIPDLGNEKEIIIYNKKNCIGWYGVFVSFILFFVNVILFTNENSEKFEMMKDQNNIQISIQVDEESESKSTKSSKKKINIFKKKDNKDLEKIVEKSDMLEGLIPDDKEKEENNIDNDIDTSEKLIVDEKKEEKEEEKDDKENNNNNDNLINSEEINKEENKEGDKEEEKKEEEKINSNEESNISKDNSEDSNVNSRKDTTSQASISILSNNLDTGVNSSILSIKQKKLINQIESKLDEFNEKSNFTNINLIPKSIDDLIMKERYTFGYLKINLLIIFSLLLISNLIKENMIMIFLIISKDSDEIEFEYTCLILSGIFLFQLFSFFFVLPLKKINIFMKRYIIAFLFVSIIFLTPLLYTPILKETIIFLSFAILGIVTLSNIITALVSCYLSYLFPPRWNYFLGRMPIYVISLGKGLGILLCLFCNISVEIGFYVLFALCVIFYGCVIAFLFLYKDFRIKIIARIIRKKAFEDKGI